MSTDWMIDRLFGMPLVESALIPERVPRVQLRHDVPCTDAFRAEMNAWLLDFFGEKTVAFVFDPSAIGVGGFYGVLGEKFLGMNPNVVAALRLELERGNRGENR